MALTRANERLGFLSYLRHECGLSENTLAAYDRDLRRFDRWRDETKRVDLASLTIASLGEYVAFLSTENLSPASVARHVASLKMFFRFLVLDGAIPRSVAELLHRPSLWDRVPAVLSERQVRDLLNAPRRDEPLYLRDRALLEVMYATGARASETAHLRWADVDLEQRFLKCKGKGNKERLIPFSPAAQDALSRYLKSLRPRLLADDDPGTLFLTKAGRPMSRIDIWKLVKRYARRVNVADRVSPHTLRHSFATHMLAQGADLRVIQEWMGHANIATTQHYTKVEGSRLKRLHQRFHPRG